MRTVAKLASRILARSKKEREKLDGNKRGSEGKRKMSSVDSVCSSQASRRSENIIVSHLEEQALADSCLLAFGPKFGRFIGCKLFILLIKKLL